MRADVLQMSAALQAGQKHMGKRPGTFGQQDTTEKDRVRSIITGQPAPASVQENEGRTPPEREKER